MSNNTTNTGDMSLLIDAAKKTYSLPNDAFDNYRIKRGLREKDGTGVMAGVTRIGNAHGYVFFTKTSFYAVVIKGVIRERIRLFCCIYEKAHVACISCIVAHKSTPRNTNIKLHYNRARQNLQVKKQMNSYYLHFVNMCILDVKDVKKTKKPKEQSVLKGFWLCSLSFV